MLLEPPCTCLITNSQYRLLLGISTRPSLECFWAFGLQQYFETPCTEKTTALTGAHSTIPTKQLGDNPSPLKMFWTLKTLFGQVKLFRWALCPKRLPWQVWAGELATLQNINIRNNFSDYLHLFIESKSHCWSSHHI